MELNKDIELKRLTVEKAKKLYPGMSIMVHRKKYGYMAMVLKVTDDMIYMVTENYANARCKWSTYGITWEASKIIFPEDSDKKVQYIKFTDLYVDGCLGDVISDIIEVTGPELTDGVIKRTSDVIEAFKKETDGDWDTDGVLEVACEHLEKEGYTCKELAESAEITF